MAKVPDTALSRRQRQQVKPEIFTSLSGTFRTWRDVRLSSFCDQKRTSTKHLDDGALPTRLFQDLRAKRDRKLTYLAAWIASFVRVPCL